MLCPEKRNLQRSCLGLVEKKDEGSGEEELKKINKPGK